MRKNTHSNSLDCHYMIEQRLYWLFYYVNANILTLNAMTTRHQANNVHSSPQWLYICKHLIRISFSMIPLQSCQKFAVQNGKFNIKTLFICFLTKL